MDWNTVGIVAGVIGGAVSMGVSLLGWGYTLGVQARRIDTMQEDIKTLMIDREAARQNMAEMKEQLATIATDIGWIKHKLERQ